MTCEKMRAFRSGPLSLRLWPNSKPPNGTKWRATLPTVRHTDTPLTCNELNRFYTPHLRTCVAEFQLSLERVGKTWEVACTVNSTSDDTLWTLYALILKALGLISNYKCITWRAVDRTYISCDFEDFFPLFTWANF
jgi:hypothetical protein